VALGSPVLNSWTVDELYQKLGEPSQLMISFDDSDSDSNDDQPLSLPKYAVPPIDVVKLWMLCAENPMVRIIDFGESWVSSKPGSPLPTGWGTPGTPRQVAPPEIVMPESPDDIGAASDVWTLACTAFEFFGCGAFFRMMGEDVDELIADMVAVLGKCPERWWNPWMTTGLGRVWYTDAGEPKDDITTARIERNLEERVRTVRGLFREQDLDEGDRTVLVRMLKVALKFEPKERTSALGLLAMLPAEWEEGKVAPGISQQVQHT
jgi:serine/threonine protein kinase